MNLHILPLHRHEGKDRSDLPGLLAADSSLTRKASRSRKEDILVLFLTLEGTATLPAADQAEALEAAARTYFEAGGSVTTALRTTAEQLNEFLLARNREGASSGLQATGVFAGVAVHHEQVYIVQSGPSFVFTVHAVTHQMHHDPLLAGNGLGVSRSTPHFFNHAPLAPGDLVILAVDPPAAWQTDSIQKAYSRPLSTIHRVLMGAAGDQIRAVILQAQRGESGFKLVRPESLEDAKAVAANPPARAATTPPTSQEAPVKAVSEPVEPPLATSGAVPQPASSLSASVETAAAPPSQEEKPKRGAEAGKAFLAVLRAFAGTLRELWYSFRALLTRLLPGSELFTLPASTMIFIAVAVPVILVTVAGVVYVRRGQVAQHDAYVQKAQEVAAFAAGRTDPDEARISWQAVLDYVDLAEEYRVSEDTQALRSQAYAALDPLEGIERLDFQPALLTPLSENVRIVRMVATRDELYMLDATTGSVIRAWLSGRGFEIDTEFQCGSFGNTTYSIGRLIDIAVLPQANSLGADIFAMDADGNVLYCTADGSAPVAQAIAPPSSNWGAPRSFVLDSGALYVLDPQTNAVWIYAGDDYSFVTPPRLFFDDVVPQMQDVIDFAVDLDDLYLLHEDGRITTCTFGFAGQPTKCTDPAPYVDTRPGRGSGVYVEGATFSQLRFSPPPDPSIYLLDNEAGAIYHFSLRLTFQRQLRPMTSREGSTAFAVSPGRMVFLAYDNEVYWALLP